MTTTRLTIRDGGRWWIRTASGSTHLLDLDQGTVLRVPDGSHPGEIASVDMRRDGDAVPLHDLYVVVGEEAYLFVSGLREGAATLRITTPVVEIWRAE